MGHAAFRELAAGAVLDDLDPEERLRFEAHRAGCRSCGALVEDLLDVAADLASLAPARRVPAALRGSVLAAIAEAAPEATSAPIRPAPSPTTRLAAVRSRLLAGPSTRHRLLDLGTLGLAAALALAAFGLAGRNAQLADLLARSRSTADGARAELAMQTGAMTVAADPAHRDVPLRSEALAPAATAVVMYVPGTTSSYVLVSDLPPTPAGKVYELWVADARGVHGLGTYAFDGQGSFVAPLGVDLAGAKATMITLEPAGGARGAPGPQVVFGAL